MLALSALISFCTMEHEAQADQLTMQAVNGARFQRSQFSPGERSAVMLRAQVLLDRAHISPGVIDGRKGPNTSRALAAYEQMHGLKADGSLEQQVWRLLVWDRRPALVSYTIRQKDVDGPFLKKVPNSLQAMAKLDHLSYTSPAALLAAKFHMDEDLLKDLNKGVDFSKAGAKIVIADVRHNQPQGPADHVEANKQRKAVIAYGKQGRVIAYYPATVGSDELPSPSGRTTIEHVVMHPKYYYHPSLDFQGVPNKNMVVPPGPNNPVGLVWIDLKKPGYGIHGSPEPAQVGKNMSHGCVRLTNWDAQELAKMLKPGTPVIFTKSKQPLPRPVTVGQSSSARAKGQHSH